MTLWLSPHSIVQSLSHNLVTYSTHHQTNARDCFQPRAIADAAAEGNNSNSSVDMVDISVDLEMVGPLRILRMTDTTNLSIVSMFEEGDYFYCISY
jgi:hypothetical protein